MRRHGRGPKTVLVRRYPRWQRGHRRYADTYIRGQTPKLSRRKTKRQLDLFGDRDQLG